MLPYERQFGPHEPFVSNAGRFLDDQVIQRWRHRAAVDWDIGNGSGNGSGSVGASLGNTYYSGDTDDNYLHDTRRAA